MSGRIFQNVVLQLKENTDRTLGVIDSEGIVIACSELSMIGQRWSECVLIVNNAAGNMVSFDGKTFSVEFHRPYDIPALTNITRSFTCYEDHVHLEDHTVYDGEIQLTERFVTLTEPRLEKGTVYLDGGRIVYDPACAEATVHTEKRDGTDEDVYLISLILKVGDGDFACDIWAE